MGMGGRRFDAGTSATVAAIIINPRIHSLEDHCRDFNGIFSIKVLISVQT